MDFIEGQSLQELLDARGRPLTEAEALPWIRQVCDALTYLHRLTPPIIHRDIKPENIIMTAEGRAILVDFGISKVYDPSKGTTIGAKAVTPGYSPPEQYGRGRTDARSDVYSLGATLYTLLTGKTPPEAPDLSSGADTLRPPRVVNKAISEATSQAIMAAMALSMGQRVGDVGAFGQMLPAGAPARSSASPPPRPPAAALPPTQPAFVPHRNHKPDKLRRAVRAANQIIDRWAGMLLAVVTVGAVVLIVIFLGLAIAELPNESAVVESTEQPTPVATTALVGRITDSELTLQPTLPPVPTVVRNVTAEVSSGLPTAIVAAAVPFSDPRDIAVDSEGYFYVTDGLNHHVQKFAPDGTFVDEWGSEGNGAGQFSFPLGIAVDGDDNVYVADNWNHRVQKFAPDGAFLAQWGSQGHDAGQLFYPEDITVDSNGNVYVADTYNHRVQEFAPDGTFLAPWGSEGSDPRQFSSPSGIAVDNHGNVYVADTGNNRIQMFSSGSTVLGLWGTHGNAATQFDSPTSIAVDREGNVYVAESVNNRVQKFTPDGKFHLALWGHQGSAAGQFNSPSGIAVDGSGNVYVADWGNHRIQKFTADGELLAVWGGEG